MKMQCNIKKTKKQIEGRNGGLFNKDPPDKNMTVQVEVYKGKKIEDILKKIQQEYDHYKILDQKKIRKFPYILSKEYEVKILIEEDRKKENEEMLKRKNQDSEEERKKQMILEMLKDEAKPKGTPQNQAYYEKEVPYDKNRELEDMKQMMKQMMSKMDEKKKVHEEKGFLMAEDEKHLRFYYEKLLKAEVKESLAQEIMMELKQILSYTGYHNKKIVYDELLKLLMNYLPVCGSFDKSSIKTIALIGPTGVGKTTTLAKIASILKNNRNKKIGLISTDVYRIAAIEQLETYANILEAKMMTASTPQELKSAIDYFKNVSKVDKILIDTVGRSPMIEESIESIKEYLDIAKPDHTAFVISATQKNSDMVRILDNFKNVNLDSVIFTKLDETLSYGFMVDALINRNLGVSYITNGQNVPKDIYLASSDKLAKQVLDGVDQFGSSNGTA